MVVTLYHQKEALEKSVLGDSLADREFSSKSFLKENEENLTPAALRFSQGFFFNFGLFFFKDLKTKNQWYNFKFSENDSIKNWFKKFLTYID